jgi:hypothetical protein
MTLINLTLAANDDVIIDSRLKGYVLLDVEVEGTGRNIIYDSGTSIYSDEPNSVRHRPANGGLYFSDTVEVDRQVNVIIQ